MMAERFNYRVRTDDSKLQLYKTNVVKEERKKDRPSRYAARLASLLPGQNPNSLHTYVGSIRYGVYQ